MLGSHKTMSFVVNSSDPSSVAIFERVLEAVGVDPTLTSGYSTATLATGQLRKLSAEKGECMMQINCVRYHIMTNLFDVVF